MASPLTLMIPHDEQVSRVRALIPTVRDLVERMNNADPFTITFLEASNALRETCQQAQRDLGVLDDDFGMDLFNGLQACYGLLTDLAWSGSPEVWLKYDIEPNEMARFDGPQHSTEQEINKRIDWSIEAMLGLGTR